MSQRLKFYDCSSKTCKETARSEEIQQSSFAQTGEGEDKIVRNVTCIKLELMAKISML